MTRGGKIGVATVAVLAIALLVAWFFHAFERRTQSVDLPSRGEAAYNPLYALKLALQRDGQRVHARRRLADPTHPLGRRDTVLMLGDPVALTARDANTLLDFVEGGGHLVVQAPASVGLGGKDGVPLLAPFGIGPRHADGACMQLPPRKDAKQKPPTLKPQDLFDDDAIVSLFQTGLFCDGRFDVAKGQSPVVAWRDAAGHVFARFDYGDGSVDVVSSMQLVRSRMLEGDADNAAVVRELLAPNWDAGTFHLLYDANVPPLWRLLLDRAWQVVVPLLLALAGWLWMRMQRFGPRIASPPADRRSLVEHVEASGEHLYRYGRAHLLHGALRRRVLSRLRRRNPVAAALEGHAQAQAISLLAGLPVADVEAALQSPRPFDAKDFRNRISALIALGRRL